MHRMNLMIMLLHSHTTSEAMEFVLKVTLRENAIRSLQKISIDLPLKGKTVIKFHNSKPIILQDIVYTYACIHVC